MMNQGCRRVNRSSPAGTAPYIAESPGDKTSLLLANIR
jgi:hypothetical protein